MVSRVIVYGGNGALGSACVSFFKNKSFWVCSVGSKENSEADSNVTFSARDSLEQQHSEVLLKISGLLKDSKVDGIFCVAGGWAGGKCSAKGFVKSMDTVVKQSLWSSTIAASLCPVYLRAGGSLVLTGAQAALAPTPGMIAYGSVKAAVHHMAKCLAEPNSGMPKDSFVAAILPETLDTPMNRKWMPNADHSGWTSLDVINELFYTWLQGNNRPPSGSLVKLITEDGTTETVVANQI